jgi:CRP-like cAMP-binding protein
VEERLQELLQLLSQELGQPVAEGTRLLVRLTHQNLANAIGTTRVTVTRLLGEFQRQGLISLDSDRHLVIHS